MKMTKLRKRQIAYFLISGAGLFILAAWFAMSSLNYSAAVREFPFRTSGWFVLGMVFILPVALGYAGVFLMASRWIGRPIACGAMLLVSAVLISLAVRSSLPTSRLRRVVGEAALNAGSIERLRVFDSFNEGVFYAGVLRGPSNLIGLIEAHRPLARHVEHDPLPHFRSVFPDIDLPDVGVVLSDVHGSFLVDADRNRVYFYYREREPSH